MSDAPARTRRSLRIGASDALFYLVLGLLSASYVGMIVAMVVADATYTTPAELLRPLVESRQIRASIVLSLISCTVTTILSLWVAIPLGYLMTRKNFFGKAFIDTVLDIPIVLPPLVVGLSLLILFRVPPFSWYADAVVYEVPGVILAQFMVACAFAVRTMRVAFEQTSARQEEVALTLGCSRNQAFWTVVIPQVRGGILSSAIIAWARALGEFGPILIFAGTTPEKTEVLPSTVFLEFQAGHLREALAVSLIMIVAATAVLLLARVLGMERTTF